MATIRLDRFGRIVIPKPMRDDLGLAPGALLRVEEQDNGLVLTPAGQDRPLAVEQGVLVFTGEAVGDMTDVVRTERERRMRQVTGMDGQ